MTPAHQTQGGRVPPHDLAAEASLLGAMLLKAEAIDAALAAGLHAADFYKPDHGLIYDACVALHQAGEPVDVVTAANKLGPSLATIGGKPFLIELQAGTPAISNAGKYAAIVDDAARQRQLIHIAGQIAELGYGSTGDVDAVERRAATILTFKPRPGAAATYDDLDEFLDDDEPEHDWVIEGLLERGDRCIVTANAGTGKSTLLRQTGTMSSGGLHPFTLAEIPPVNVLLLDIENSKKQVRREIRPLRKALGDRYEPGRFRLRVFQEPIHIADPSTLTELCRDVERLQPDIILMGPLYKLLDGDTTAEEPARRAAAALDKLRHVAGSALIIEAHSPYASGGAKREIRPYGASLWERWPEYGWHFNPAGDITHWRGQREERDWPTAIERSSPWPWAVRQPAERVAGEPWSGPTKCVDAIVDLIAANPTEEFSGTNLTQRITGFREVTVRKAAEIAATRGLIKVRNGPRNARLFSAKSAELLTPADPIPPHPGGDW